MCNMNGVGKVKINLFWLKTRSYRCSLLCYNRLALHSRTHASLYVKSARLITILCLIGVGKGQLTFFLLKTRVYCCLFL